MKRDHGRIVVHGHTISETADMRPNRIGIDTGAYRTGVLTALGLEGPDRWLLQTRTGEHRLARAIALPSIAPLNKGEYLPEDSV